ASIWTSRPARAGSISSRTGSMRPSSLVVSRWPSRRLRWPRNWKPRASSDGRITSALQEPAITSGGRDELPVTTGSDRCCCMALGGGSLMAGIAGLVLPRGGKGVRNHKRQGILAALGKLGPDSLLPGLADIDKPPGEVRPPRAITAENAGYLTSPDRVRSAPPGLGLVQNDRL